jgi:hypothetical protein
MTFLSVALFDVDIGLYVGICTSFIINTVRTQKYVDVFSSILHFILPLIRPRFFVLGQVDNTGIYKSVTYFPSVRVSFVHTSGKLFMYIGTTKSKNKNSSF